MKKLLFLLIFYPLFIFSQNLQSHEILWDSSRNLKKDDYTLISDEGNFPVKSSINLLFHIKGFDVFSKNFNKNILNTFNGSASYINLRSQNIEDLLIYQQLVFDLSEVYARKIRKELLINKSKIWKNLDWSTDTFQRISSNLSKIQMQMDTETQYGQKVESVNSWKQKIHDELTVLAEYDYNNSLKIKVKN